jgi:hypothetical protein
MPLAFRLRSENWIAPLALGALLLIGALVLVHQTHGSTFYLDEWDWILNRRDGGLRTFLEPHEQHLSLLPLVTYRILIAVFGIRRYWPYLAVLIAAQLAVVALLFLYAAPRVGTPLALLAAASIMFFGPGSIDFLWAFQMAWLFAIACGIGALLALDRGDRVGNAIACGLSALALASASPGLAVVLGLAVEVLWTRPLRQAWIVLAPLAAYGLWWIAFQQAAFQREALLHVAPFVASSASAALSGLAGLLTVNPLGGTDFLTWGPPLLVIALFAIAWRVRRLGRVSPRLAALIVMALSFWIATALARGVFRIGILTGMSHGDESRYLYVSGVLIVLLAVELASGWRPSLPVGTLIGALGVAAIISNVNVLRQQASYLRASGTNTSAYLGTMDMTRAIIRPSFLSAGFLFAAVRPGSYFPAERELGTPAFGPRRLAGASEAVREAADSQLIAIHAVRLEPVPARALARSACEVLNAATGEHVQVPRGGLEFLARGGNVGVELRRFASNPRPLGSLAVGRAARLRIAPDGAPEPWQLDIDRAVAASVCAASGNWIGS